MEPPGAKSLVRASRESYRGGDVIAVPHSDRFSLLTGRASELEWRWLGAIGLEHGLSRGVLVALAGEGADTKALDAWLKHSVTSGLLRAVGPTRALSLSSAPTREPGYALAPDMAQLVLRALARRGALQEVALATHGLLGGRSVSDLGLALQLGDYRSFAKRFSVERLPRQIPLRTAAEWLRVSLCEPFDAAWLVATWGEDAHATAMRVLQSSAETGSDCTGLYEWLEGRLEELPEGELHAELAELLCEHAALRGRPDVIPTVAARLPRSTALGHAAVWAFLTGDLPLAQARLEELFGAALRPGGGARRGPLPQAGAALPLLALLLCARDNEAALALAKRLMSVGSSEPQRAAGRAFRLLLRYLEEPESEHERIDVHDLSADALWETLLSALNVELHQKQPEVRARWAQHVVRSAVSWHAAGYRWVAEQAVALSRSLSPDYANQELERLGGDIGPAASRLSLWDLVAPKPEWQKTLQALSVVAGTAGEAAEASVRAIWYVDMADGSLSRPALSEHRLEGGGWSQGRRLTPGELFQYRDQLPDEDQRVLDATRDMGEGRRELAPEAYERLIGHSRVFNGARGARVEVVRGTCRVEAEEEAGYIRVVVEPAGAKLGVNVVPEGEERLLVYRVTEAMQRVIDVLPHGVRVPLAQKGELLKVLGVLSQSVDVQSSELGAERTVEANATPCLRFAVHAGAWMVQAGVRPFGSQGRFFVAGVGRSSVSFVGAEGRLRCERDFERERASVDALVAACPSLQHSLEEQEGRAAHEVDNWVLGEEAVLVLLSELRASGITHELEWPESNRMRLRGDGRSSLTGRLRVDKGWYLATGGLRLDDVNEVTLAELVHAPALAGGRFVRLENGDYVELEERIRRVIAALSASSRGKGRGPLRIHPGALASLDELSGDGLQLDESAERWVERVRQVSEQDFELPASLVADLRPYQRDGYRWLRQLSELELGACLADDMGLGKTVQLLALLLARHQEGAALVVAPTSVCGNWAREARRFAPSLEVLEYTGDRRDELLDAVKRDGRGKLLVVSYALLQQDQAKLTEIRYGTAVLDEAQFIKNSQSLRAQAAFRIDAGQRIAATGTPVENHAADLWSIFNFVNPGLLGDFADFNRRFVKPIDREGGEAPEVLLQRVIRPYVMRRLKRDVLRELPPLTEVAHEVELSKDETARYAVLRKQIHDKLFTPWGKRENKLEVLAEITRLRRFCCHPRLVFPEADLESSKVQVFLDLVEELRENGHRALVFSQFVDFLSLVREQLEDRRIAYEYLDGSTPQAERQKRVDAFQNGSASLFLISLKAGGFGLNLTAADYVIHLDPWWNPAVESQATDRAHRIGQQRRVTVYRLVTKNTIEEKIVELHEKKRNLARTLLDGGTKAEQLGTDELLRLIDDPGI
ncbi:MAG: SNF2-related protein [Polyangiaceae bacterium]|jgi:superfamily II DNA or RNA helicase|nr:SNF2-related protein [Polyangiaceae bacterium]